MDGKFIIDNLLRQEESDRLVFKQWVTEEELAKNVTAMLNGKGGDIVIGVDDKKNVIGVPDFAIDVSYLSLTTQIRPSAPIDIRFIDYDGKTILLIGVWEGAQKPYLCNGKIYQKVGDKIKVANPDNIGEILEERRKADFNWISVIRLPDFVAKEDFEWAIQEAARKKKEDFSKVEFLTIEEGLCVQCMHIGLYDDEPATVEQMHAFAKEQGYEPDFSEKRLHHEIYLSDPRKVDPEKNRTVIRHPVRKV